MTSLSPPSFSFLNSPPLPSLFLLFFSFFLLLLLLLLFFLLYLFFVPNVCVCMCVRMYVCVYVCRSARSTRADRVLRVRSSILLSFTLSSFRDYLRNAQPSILRLTNFLAFTLTEPRRKGHGSKE